MMKTMTSREERATITAMMGISSEGGSCSERKSVCMRDRGIEKERERQRRKGSERDKYFF